MKWFLVIVVGAVFVKKSFCQDIFETVEAIAGQTAEIPCIIRPAVSGDKLNFVAWYRNDSRPGSPAIYSSRDLRPRSGKISALPPPGRYRLVEGQGVERLLVHKVRAEDAGVYYCVADFVASPVHKTYVYVTVIEPPERMWVIHENGTRVATSMPGAPAAQTLGPFHVGEMLRLFCVTFGGKPQPKLSWWKGGALFKQSSTPLSDRRVRADVTHGPLRPSDHGLVLTCRANNNNITKHLFVDITLDMYLPPELVTVQAIGGADAVRAGDELRLQCRVLGARPAPEIVWAINDNQIYNLEQNVTKERSQRLVVSSARLVMAREYDEARVTCCAKDDRHFVCAEPVTLTVYYSPMLEVVVDGEITNGTLKVVKGSNVTLNCSVSANPWIYDFTWYHEEEIISTNTSDGGIKLSNISEGDAGEYVCAGANVEGATTSDPVLIDVLYPPYCTNKTVLEYGLAENEYMNLTCSMTSNPGALEYRWMQVEGVYNVSTLNASQPCFMFNDTDSVLEFTRPGTLNFVTVFCWALNGLEKEAAPSHYPCTFVISHETVPRPPADCVATKKGYHDIMVHCAEGHNGGLPQKFILTVTSLETNSDLISIINLEPSFIVQAPTVGAYRFVVGAFNDKGPSQTVTIEQEDISQEKVDVPTSAVSDIALLSLALCGGVALVALAACGLVLCARDPTPAPKESNCGMFEESDDDSECNLRRTDSFRRALAQRRMSSFRSARDVVPDMYPGACRVHSLQNLMMQLPTDFQNNSKQNSTFYTMPRKNRPKIIKDPTEEGSVITQSDRFSLPPPPDEFTSYRSGVRISAKEALRPPTLTKNCEDDDPRNPFNEVIISPMNTVGLPACGQGRLYAYPDEQTQNVRPRGTHLSTFQNNFSSPKESGF